MSMQMRTTGLVAALALAASTLGAVSARADEIKIGVNMPLTGAFAASGNYVADGARIAAEEINAKGGVLGQKIRLVVEDNKSNPTEAAAVAEKLISSDKVPVMMGAWGSSLTLAVLPKLRQYGVPMVVETSSSSKITKQGNPYVFRISAPSSLEAKNFSKDLGDFKIKKADFLVVNNDWGRGTATDFSEMFKEHNIEVGLTETMDQGAQDLSGQLSKIKGSDADTLIVTTAVEQLTLVLRQIRTLGLKKQIITTGGSQSPDQLIAQAGDAADGAYHLLFFTPWKTEATPYPEKAKAFVDAWNKKKLPVAGLTESFRGYDGVNVIAAAIEKAGAADPEKITKALWDVKVEGLNGEIVFAKDGPSGRESGQSSPNTYVVKIEGGKVEVVR